LQCISYHVATPLDRLQIHVFPTAVVLMASSEPDVNVSIIFTAETATVTVELGSTRIDICTCSACQQLFRQHGWVQTAQARPVTRTISGAALQEVVLVDDAIVIFSANVRAVLPPLQIVKRSDEEDPRNPVVVRVCFVRSEGSMILCCGTQTGSAEAGVQACVSYQHQLDQDLITRGLSRSPLCTSRHVPEHAQEDRTIQNSDEIENSVGRSLMDTVPFATAVAFRSAFDKHGYTFTANLDTSSQVSVSALLSADLSQAMLAEVKKVVGVLAHATLTTPANRASYRCTVVMTSMRAASRIREHWLSLAAGVGVIADLSTGIVIVLPSRRRMVRQIDRVAAFTAASGVLQQVPSADARWSVRRSVLAVAIGRAFASPTAGQSEIHTNAVKNLVGLHRFAPASSGPFARFNDAVDAVALFLSGPFRRAAGNRGGAAGSECRDPLAASGQTVPSAPQQGRPGNRFDGALSQLFGTERNRAIALRTIGEVGGLSSSAAKTWAASVVGCLDVLCGGAFNAPARWPSLPHVFIDCHETGRLTSARSAADDREISVRVAPFPPQPFTAAAIPEHLRSVPAVVLHARAQKSDDRDHGWSVKMRVLTMTIPLIDASRWTVPLSRYNAAEMTTDVSPHPAFGAIEYDYDNVVISASSEKGGANIAATIVSVDPFGEFPAIVAEPAINCQCEDTELIAELLPALLVHVSGPGERPLPRSAVEAVKRAIASMEGDTAQPKAKHHRAEASDVVAASIPRNAHEWLRLHRIAQSCCRVMSVSHEHTDAVYYGSEGLMSASQRARALLRSASADVGNEGSS
jgi:hypothetical protein